MGLFQKPLRGFFKTQIQKPLWGYFLGCKIRTTTTPQKTHGFYINRENSANTCRSNWLNTSTKLRKTRKT